MRKRKRDEEEELYEEDELEEEEEEEDDGDDEGDEDEEYDEDEDGGGKKKMKLTPLTIVIIIVLAALIIFALLSKTGMLDSLLGNISGTAPQTESTGDLVMGGTESEPPYYAESETEAESDRGYSVEGESENGGGNGYNVVTATPSPMPGETEGIGEPESESESEIPMPTATSTPIPTSTPKPLPTATPTPVPSSGTFETEIETEAETESHGTVISNETQSNINAVDLIFIGDSRFRSMANNVTTDKDISYECSSSGNFSWLTGTAYGHVDSYIGDGTQVFINIGINDLTQYAAYASSINAKASEWEERGASVYFVSVGPVAAASNILNSDICNFNTYMYQNLDIPFIDMYNYLVRVGFETTTDNATYTQATNQAAYDYLNQFIN